MMVRRRKPAHNIANLPVKAQWPGLGKPKTHGNQSITVAGAVPE